MARRFLNYDPQSGLLTTTAFEDGRNVVHYQQDVSTNLDYAAAVRSETDVWKRGVKQSFAPAAHVPALVICDMKFRFGVDFWDKSQRKRVLELIEKEYPRCKLTDKRLA